MCFIFDAFFFRPYLTYSQSPSLAKTYLEFVSPLSFSRAIGHVTDIACSLN